MIAAQVGVLTQPNGWRHGAQLSGGRWSRSSIQKLPSPYTEKTTRARCDEGYGPYRELYPALKTSFANAAAL